MNPRRSVARAGKISGVPCHAQARCHKQWHTCAMRITIDSSGRVVVPKALRDALGITGGATLEAIVRDGRIELEVPPAEVRIERRGDVLVAVPGDEVRPLRTDVVRATLDAIRSGP